MSYKKDLSRFLVALISIMPLSSCATVKKIGNYVKALPDYLAYKQNYYNQYYDDNRTANTVKRRILEEQILSKAKLEVIGEGSDKVYVLYAKGTPYEIGFQHGRLLKKQVRENVGNVMNLSELIKNWLKEDDVKALENGYDLLEPYIPERYKEEMRGLADGAGLKIEAVQFMQAVGDIVENGCSNYFLDEKATLNGDLIQVRILDFPLDLEVQRNPLISIIKPVEGHSYATIGWAGFLGAVTGISSEKIALGEMRGDNAVEAYRKINNLEEKSETLRGIPMPFLLRDVLQFDTNLEEVTARLFAAERTNCYVYIIGDGEAGTSRAYLTDHELFKVYTSDNFKEVLSVVEPETKFSGREGVIFGGHNNAMLNEQLNNNYGKITEEMIKQEFNDKLAMADNLQIAIYNLTKMTVQVANAEGKTKWESNASKQGYVLLDLNKAFGWFNHN